MFRVLVRITLRPSILDPQGKAVRHALHQLGMDAVADVRSGKHIDLLIAADGPDAAAETAREACRKLLANPVTEDFEVVHVEPAEASVAG
jgi:phosphoribosylformylglycinamidine synthase